MQSYRDGQTKWAEFCKGELTAESPGIEASTAKSGTHVAFEPDNSIFKNYHFIPQYLDSLFWNYAFLNAGLTINYNGEKYFSQNGLFDLLSKKTNSEEKRYLLRAKIVRDEQVIHEETAVNEVSILRWVTPSMIEIVTKIDNVFLNSQRSDGLIISTPTGSTAYSLSAGGPILYPSLNALVLVPLNPHTLSNRPIVIHDTAEIEISFCQTKQINALVTCDHIEIPDVLISDKILIKKDPLPIRILHPEGHDFFQILRNKLNWSSGYHI